MIIKSSRALYDFYVDWLAWAEGGSSKNIYSRRRGLCLSVPWNEETEMVKQFRSAGLCAGYPFCSQNEFFMRRDSATMHLDKNRLAWVRARIADGVKDGE